MYRVAESESRDGTTHGERIAKRTRRLPCGRRCAAVDLTSNRSEIVGQRDTARCRSLSPARSETATPRRLPGRWKATQCQEKKSAKLAQELAAKSRALAVDTCQACSATRKNVGAARARRQHGVTATGYVKSPLTAVPGVARPLAHYSHADGDGRHGTGRSVIAGGLT